jgi:hypothetical protein
MANWPGLLMILAGAWLIWSALGRRSRVRAALARGEGPPPLNPSLVMMAEIMPPLITFGLVVAAAQVVLAFMATDGAGFSVLDLGGFLFLLLAYGIWVRMRTRYREVSGR